MNKFSISAITKTNRKILSSTVTLYGKSTE